MRMAVVLMMMALVSGCGNDGSLTKPDLILTGGHILTLAETPNNTSPTAVAMADGKILDVGTDEQILKTKGPDTKVVDLKGATVIPGLVDSPLDLTEIPSLSGDPLR